MGDVDWSSAIAALSFGLVLGAVLVAMVRRSPGVSDHDGDSGRTRAEARAIRIEDLAQRKQQLLQQIRDVEDTALPGGIASAPAERDALELEAAKVLRELHHLRGAPEPDSAAERGLAPAAPAAVGMDPSLKGALVGGAVVGFAALLVIGLQDGASTRTGDMPMTGGPVAGDQPLTAPPPGSGRPGEAVQGVPPSLQPQQSGRVDAARADVSANPASVEARIELGWALIEAEGWIDVFNNAAQLLEMEPGNPDGLTQQAVVRMKMGMSQPAEALIDQALVSAPAHGRALAWKGSLRWQAGDTAGAQAAWGLGAELYPGEGFDELLSMARGEVTPGMLGMEHPDAGAGPGHPAEASQPARAEPVVAAGGKVVTGTVTLADGVDVPPGATLFVFGRLAGQTAGPPLAAVRLPASRFPMTFSIGPSDMPPMMGKRAFPDSLSLAARLDLDGNATTKDGPSGAAAGDVAAGATGVVIVLRP